MLHVLNCLSNTIKKCSLSVTSVQIFNTKIRIKKVAVTQANFNQFQVIRSKMSDIPNNLPSCDGIVDGIKITEPLDVAIKIEQVDITIEVGHEI